MKRPVKIAALLMIAAFLVVGCARTPNPRTSQKVINKYFKKYGKKYPTTVYGQDKVTQVEVTGIKEIHRHLVSADTFLTLGSGQVQRIHATLMKGPWGWKFVSWELAAQSSESMPQ